MLQDDDALSLVNAAEDDGDGAFGQTRPDAFHVFLEHRPRLRRFGLLRHERVVLGQLGRPHHTRAVVLGAADLLLDEGRTRFRRRLRRFLLQELVDRLLVVHFSASEADDARLEAVISSLSLVLVLRHLKTEAELKIKRILTDFR